MELEQNKTHKYLNIKKQLLEIINKSNPDDRLPSRGELTKMFGVARTTIERAISELVGEGYLYSTKGSGTYILNTKNNTTVAKPQTWALLLSNIMYDIYPHVLRGVEDVASKKGIHLNICNTDNDHVKEDMYLRNLLDANINGIIIIPSIYGGENIDTFAEYAKRNIPIVSCIRPIPNYLTPSVSFNSHLAGFLGTQHLLNCGCKNVSFIASDIYSASLDRYEGYLTALHSVGVTPNSKYIRLENLNDNKEEKVKMVRSLLSENPEIDGIFAFNDRLALAVYEVLKEMNLTAGKDIRIVSCDDTSICSELPVKLSSIRFPVYDIGMRAANLLCRISNGEEILTNHIEILNNELIVRDS